MFNVQYGHNFVEQLEIAPDFIQAEFVEMYLDLQVVSRSGDRFKVVESIEEPDAFHMLCDSVFAWVTYTVSDDSKMVTVFNLVNARDLL